MKHAVKEGGSLLPRGYTSKGAIRNSSLVLCVSSLMSIWFERLCSLSASDGRRGFGFTGFQIRLFNSWGKEGLVWDLLPFSRYKRAVMKIYEPSLQGMGVSVQANVMACLLFLPHPLHHATTWWSTENDAFPWKSVGHWLGNIELKV